jgi:hypothetical protein
LGVFFSGRGLDINGHTTHTFGKTLQLFIADAPKEPVPAPPQEDAQPSTAASTTAVEAPSAPLDATPQAIASTAPLPSPLAAPVIPEQLAPPAATSQAVIPKKVKKAPPPPLPKEPRPRISDEHSQAAKEVVAALPEIQAAARSSRSLKPTVPFTDAEIVSTLHILKNGEKPGTKKLKAVLDYVSNDSNFRDAIASSRLRSTREALSKILHSLLS